MSIGVWLQINNGKDKNIASKIDFMLLCEKLVITTNLKALRQAQGDHWQDFCHTELVEVLLYLVIESQCF